MGRLTVAKAKSIQKPGIHGDGATLFLRVAAGGSKSWVQRLTIDAKRRDIGLGGFPLVSLAEAREAAFRNRKLARTGGDPLAEKRKAKTPTFRQATEKTHETLKPRWRNDHHAISWIQTLQRHAFPVLGDMPVDRIGREDVLRVLTPIWGTRVETARRVRQRIRTVLRWCEAHGYIDRNVAGDAISGALPAMPAVRDHFQALPYQDVRTALETVEASGASMSAKLCLRFLVMTAARSSKVRSACWDEIHIDQAVWTIPATRMKSQREHRVPLSDAVLGVLEQARELNDGSSFVFPSPLRRGKPLSNMTFTKVRRDRGFADKATVHGFRSSFRDWCAETGKPRGFAAFPTGPTAGTHHNQPISGQQRSTLRSGISCLKNGETLNHHSAADDSQSQNGAETSTGDTAG